eukprot:g800.t1
MHKEEIILESEVHKTNDEVDKVHVRTRPTNNQLLYKAYFRWQHYPVSESSVFQIEETDACASVTAAFLQVMCTLQEVEALRYYPEQRNILKILSEDTRRTKVVNIANTSHKVSEELKKHSFTDNDGTQFTTNLDRNRYGGDNQYMVTVIRHNLSVLKLCPCLVDVEVLDQKSNETTMISAGIHRCSCLTEGGGRDHRKSNHIETNKQDKHSGDGHSYSPESSTNTDDDDDDNSFKSRGTRQGPNLRRRTQQSSWNRGEMEGKTRTRSTREISSYRSFDCVTTRRQRRLKNDVKKLDLNLEDHMSLPFDAYRRKTPSPAFNQDYFKRNRDTDNAEGVYDGDGGGFGDNNTRVSRRQKTQKDRLTMEQQTKHFKWNYDGLNCTNLVNCNREEDCARIKRLEDEIQKLRENFSQFATDAFEMEIRLNSYRTLIGQLLNLLHQQLQAKSVHCSGEIQGQSGGGEQSSVKGQKSLLNSLSTLEQGFGAIKESNGKKKFNETATQWIPSHLAPSLPFISEFSASPSNNRGQQIKIENNSIDAEKLIPDVEYARTPSLGVFPKRSLGLTEGSFDLGYDSMLNFESSPAVLPSVTWKSPDPRLSISQKLKNV